MYCLTRRNKLAAGQYLFMRTPSDTGYYILIYSIC